MRSHRPVRSENPVNARRTLFAAALAVAALLPQMASAQDSLKLAVGQRGNWASSVAEVGQRAGIFKKHGLTLDLLYTQGSGETQQAVIAESVDVGVAAGTMGAMSAFAKGAPVRIIAAETTGASDLYWYVKADSPIKTIKDFDGKTVAYSTNGSSTHMVVMAFIKQFGLKVKAVGTGGPIPTLTQLMSGQIDVGWAAPPDGLDQLDRGEIRYIANGNDAEIFKGQTVRVNITNARTLATRADAMTSHWPIAKPRARSTTMPPRSRSMPIGSGFRPPRRSARATTSIPGRRSIPTRSPGSRGSPPTP